MSDNLAANSVFTSPLAGEVDREAIGRGVVPNSAMSALPPSLTLPHKGGGNRPRAWRGLRLRLVTVLLLFVGIAAAFAWWIAALGPAPLGENLSYSTLVVDREGRLLRPYTTSEGRWRLPATRESVDPRFVDMLLAYEDKRFRSHHGVDLLSLGRAASQLLTNGRIVSGASTLTMQVARLLEPRAERSFTAKFRQMVRAHRDRAETLQGRDPRALSQPRALWRQSRRRPRRFARLFRQGAAPPDLGRSSPAGRAAAIARAAPARPFGRQRPQRP